MANRWMWRRADRAAAARSFGPLAVAIALAAGIAVAPALDRIGVAPGLRWLGVAAVVIAWRRALRRRGALLLAAGLALGAARGAPGPGGGAGGSHRGRPHRGSRDRRGPRPVVHGPRGDGARLDTATAGPTWPRGRAVRCRRRRRRSGRGPRAPRREEPGRHEGLARLAGATRDVPPAVVCEQGELLGHELRADEGPDPLDGRGPAVVVPAVVIDQAAALGLGEQAAEAQLTSPPARVAQATLN
jgi:hypothetical protein